MIIFFQHVYPIFDYRERAETQRERIRKAFQGTDYPYRLISIQADSEKETLERLSFEAVRGEAAYFFYVHLKGITHPGDLCVSDWCELLEYQMIDRWRLVREKLERGADAVGVNYEKEPWPHYAGNFFACRHDAVKTLKPIELVENPEMWIGTSRKKDFVMASMHDSATNHYQEHYPPERYR